MGLYYDTSQKPRFVCKYRASKQRPCNVNQLMLTNTANLEDNEPILQRCGSWHCRGILKKCIQKYFQIEVQHNNVTQAVLVKNNPKQINVDQHSEKTCIIGPGCHVSNVMIFVEVHGGMIALCCSLLMVEGVNQNLSILCCWWSEIRCWQYFAIL